MLRSLKCSCPLFFPWVLIPECCFTTLGLLEIHSLWQLRTQTATGSCVSSEGAVQEQCSAVGLDSHLYWVLQWLSPEWILHSAGTRGRHCWPTAGAALLWDCSLLSCGAAESFRATLCYPAVLVGPSGLLFVMLQCWWVLTGWTGPSRASPTRCQTPPLGSWWRSGSTSTPWCWRKRKAWKRRKSWDMTTISLWQSKSLLVSFNILPEGLFSSSWFKKKKNLINQKQPL